MGSELAISDATAEAVDKLLRMDINDLSLADRSKYLWFMAQRMGLDPLTKPFDCIPDGRGKMILFANAGCADQLRRRDKVSVEVLEEGFIKVGDTQRDDVYVVKVLARNSEGRTQINIGAVGTKGLTNDSLANALMKCHTKAGRRATLDICGLGIPDISELDSIPSISVKSIPTSGPKILNPGVPQSSSSFPEAKVEVVEDKDKKYPPAVPPIKIPRS